MPQIPTIMAPSQVSIPEANPGVTPASAMIRTGQEMQGIADMGLDVDEKIRKAQEHLALLAAGNQVTASWNQYQEGLAKSGDPDNMPDPEAWKNELKDQFQQNPKYADPRVQRALESHIDSVGEDARHATVMRQLTLQRQQEIGNLDQLKQTVTYEMAEAPDLTMRSLARGRYETAVSDAERHGWISPKEAQDTLHNLDATAEDVEIVNAIDKDNPASIQAMIDKTSTHPELFKDLDPKRFAELKKTLRTAYDVAKDRSDRQDVSRDGDVLLTKVKNDITLKDPETKEFDPIAAANKIDNDPNVPTKVKKYVRTELEEEAGAQQKMQNDRDQKVLDELDPHVEAGQLTFKDISRRMNLPAGSQEWIPRRVGDHLLTRAAQIARESRTESMQERSMMRQEAAEKSADIANQLLFDPGYLTDKSELVKHRIDGLNVRDANAVWAAKGIKNAPEWGPALSRIQSSPLFDTTTDEGKTKMMNFVASFAKTVEDKKLTGTQITDELTRELKPQEDNAAKTTIGERLDMLGGIVGGWIGSPRMTNYFAGRAVKDAPQVKAPDKPKGVPDSAVWNPQGNGGKGAWQLPNSK